ncbi:MAG TPA: glycosyltransferase family 39 protein [Bryobacteraceae bacterium]|nr:glycosyltransferase family 39 protein [Bryobacteraceae bacterium]
MAPQQQMTPAAKLHWRLEPIAARIERFCEQHETSILAVWTLIYFAGTMRRAMAKPFWYDEILTLLEARQPNLHAAMHALGDVDWMPPASHFTFYLTGKLLGFGEVAFRIPLMIAFGVFCICLYFFARRRVGVFFALTAMLLPYASAFQSYSYEARTYAFLLGFSGVALLAWQSAIERIQRPWSLFGIAAGIAGAIAFQYWAVLIYLPLAGAEAYRSLRRRRIDWPIWIAFIAGGTPTVLLLPLILHGVKSWVSYAGMRAHPVDYITSYSIAFRAGLAFALPAALLLAAWFIGRGYKEEPAGTRQAVIPRYEWIAVTILLLLPVAAVSIALIVPPHSFSLRYAAPVVAGYALLGSFLAARLAGKRSSIGLACVLAALAPFLYLMTQPVRFKDPFQRFRGLQQRLQDGPVAFEDPVPYLKVWYYTPDRLKPHLVCIRDVPPLDIRHDPLYHLREFQELGIPFVQYADFVRPGTNFPFYPDIGRHKSRLVRAIEAGGGSVERIDSSPPRPLMLAHIR